MVRTLPAFIGLCCVLCFSVLEKENDSPSYQLSEEEGNKKTSGRLLVTNWKNIVARCRFLVPSLNNLNDTAHSMARSIRFDCLIVCSSPEVNNVKLFSNFAFVSQVFLSFFASLQYLASIRFSLY